MNLQEAKEALGIKKFDYRLCYCGRYDCGTITMGSIHTTGVTGKKVKGTCRSLVYPMLAERLTDLVVTSYEEERNIVFRIGDPLRITGWVCWYSTVLRKGELMVNYFILSANNGVYILMKNTDLPDNARLAPKGGRS